MNEYGIVYPFEAPRLCQLIEGNKNPATLIVLYFYLVGFRFSDAKTKTARAIRSVRAIAGDLQISPATVQARTKKLIECGALVRRSGERSTSVFEFPIVSAIKKKIGEE